MNGGTISFLIKVWIHEIFGQSGANSLRALSPTTGSFFFSNASLSEAWKCRLLNCFTLHTFSIFMVYIVGSSDFFQLFFVSAYLESFKHDMPYAYFERRVSFNYTLEEVLTHFLTAHMSSESERDTAWTVDMIILLNCVLITRVNTCISLYLFIVWCDIYRTSMMTYKWMLILCRFVSSLHMPRYAVS